MPQVDNLFMQRKSLDEICTVPEKIISVYSLERHVWADGNAEEARKARQPELQSIDEFQIDPVRPFLNDILRNMAAPYNPVRKENPIGQGYWIQAEFGSGKSHLLCFLAALTLGSKTAWEIVRKKEDNAGRGKRESIYRFYEEGLKTKSEKGKGIFVVVKTLVGSGGGTVGLTDKGRKLSEYILDAVKEQLQSETGKNLSLYPAELLADRFVTEDVDRYRGDLKKFLREPRFFEEDEFEDVGDFIRDIQQNKSPEYKRSCGNKLWRFYTEYLKVQPHIAAETEDILKHLVETVLAEGYAGILLVLDEVSLFMKNRDEDQRTDDEKTLVVLSNRLAKIHNLPLWTVCAAQQAIESKMGVKNIIADDRLKLVKLLEEDKDYYDIVLNRVRYITNPGAITNYYLHYKRGFSWPASIGEKEFAHFFPFHKPAVEVLRAITYELTTARSAIHFMHQTLKHQLKQKGKELIRLWELFDEAVRYEEDPSGVHAGLVAIKTKRETDYLAYEACKRQIDSLTKGFLKVHRDKAVKTVQTLFLYHIARTRQQGLAPEEIANAVLIERSPDANIDENVQHYETLAENLKKELRQITQTYDEDHRPRFRFDPVFTGVDPRDEFKKARDEAEGNIARQREAWEHLLALEEWPIRTRQMTIDLSNGVKSIFRDIAPFVAPWEDRTATRAGDQEIELVWQGRQVAGLVAMRELGKVVRDNLALPGIDSDQTERDFAVFVSTQPILPPQVTRLIDRRKDPRILFWTPGELRTEERDRLMDFAAYRKLVEDWQGKDTEDAVAVINWVANALQSDLGKIYKIIPDSYARGQVDAWNNTLMDFHVAGELRSILTPLVDRILMTAYESRDIKFEPPFIFRKEEGVKLINGIVKTGEIPKGAKPNQNISAAQNFGFGLGIIKRAAEKKLDVSDNLYVQNIWNFLDEHLSDEGQTIKVETLYKNFMGVGGPEQKNYGLTRRMVQIFLLCLVREGRVRIGLNSRSGLPFHSIDYTNVADIDFSARILDALAEVQKVARPEHWEVLRPYAEKLLDETIEPTHDDGVISACRKRLQELFAREKDEAKRVSSQARELFEFLQVANPYEKEINQIAALFATDITAGNDINLILYGLKEALNYQAFDVNAVQPQEVDDLANRLRNYRDVQHFLTYEREVRAAHTYCTHQFPDREDLKPVRRMQRKLAEKMNDLQPFIDSDVKLKTELIGHIPPETGENGTLGCLVYEYTTVYVALHDAFLGHIETEHARIQELLQSSSLRALRKLEDISALQPAIASSLETQMSTMASEFFSCSSPSRVSLEERLQTRPFHDCGLTFSNAPEFLATAKKISASAERLFNNTLDRKLEVFLSPAVHQRLEQGKKERFIEELLRCTTVNEIREVLVPAVLKEESVVGLINRYLKRIKVKKVRLTDFRPTLGTIEKEQIPVIVREFQQFLERQLNGAGYEKDELPVLQVE